MSASPTPLPTTPLANQTRDELRQRYWARAWWSVSLALFLIGISATAWQPAALAALSLIPAWCWLLAGLATLILARRLRPRAWWIVLAAVWLLFLIRVEEYRSLSRSVWSRFTTPRSVEPGELRLRVVSVNCADGSLRTAREAAALTPDILLLQESPGRDDLEQLATELFGESHGVLWSADTSIVARWPIQPMRGKDTFVVGLVQPSGGPEIVVVSLRLAPPIVRYDLWNPACWREQTAKRQQHENQIGQLSESEPLLDGFRDINILGGDFNAAQHDRSTTSLRQFARDTFDVAGRGWGNTVLNTIPVLRFDQIWASRHFRPIATWAVRTQHSDHRMVVSDLVLPARWAERGRVSSP